jgi:hypothetical protein
MAERMRQDAVIRKLETSLISCRWIRSGRFQAASSRIRWCGWFPSTGDRGYRMMPRELQERAYELGVDSDRAGSAWETDDAS